MRSATTPLFLYDIDGTLLLTSGSGYRSFLRACNEVLGIDGPLHNIHMAGKLDRVIFHEIVEMFRPDLTGSDNTPYWERFRSLYVEYLTEESLNPAGWRLLPGVRRLVEYTAGLGRLALLTGNISEGARLKVGTLGLGGFFPTGGFGEEYMTRARLAEVAYERACEHYRTRFQPSATYVLGDTVNDITAARAIGARVIAVATGTVTLPELAQAGPDLLVEDFETGEERIRSFLSS
ncbi:MAG TPA: HAD family hydrolase [Candidatus Glassbacteria bacterium]|nr:HAD family hydrolase [Candidatus Glassbacteria bacterium]